MVRDTLCACVAFFTPKPGTNPSHYCQMFQRYSPRRSLFRAQPNIRRTFPGDDKGRKKDDDDEDDQPVVAYRGKQLRVGGKHLGSMRPQSEEEDEDSDEESNEEEAHNYARGGKQLRPSAGGGKYLRP